jgi:general secretion pathway protein J
MQRQHLKSVADFSKAQAACSMLPEWRARLPVHKDPGTMALQCRATLTGPDFAGSLKGEACGRFKNVFSDNGFSLLELLVALALMVILSGALYGTYFSLMRGRDMATAKMDERRELSVTLDRLRRELSAAFYNTANKRLHFVVEDRDYFGKPASILDFTALAPPRSDQQPVSDQVQLIYQGAEKEKKLQLERQEKDIYATIAPLPYPQMEELEGFLVECYDNGIWVRTWDTTLNNGRLPTRVKITISLKEGVKTMDYSTIAIPRMGS